MNLEELPQETYGKLYLWAASHFLSGFPQDWDGEKLARVMLAEEGDEHYDDRAYVNLWNPMKYLEGDDIWLETDCYIETLMSSLSDLPKEVLDILIKTN